MKLSEYFENGHPICRWHWNTSMPRLISVIVVVLLAWYAVGFGPERRAEGKDKPTPSHGEYDQWVKHYVTDKTVGWFPQVSGGAKNVQVPVKLVITAIEGDDPESRAREQERSYGCEVAADGRVSHFYHTSFGHKGGGYPVLSGSDRKRLDQLILTLPNGGARLPPPTPNSTKVSEFVM